MMRSTVLFPEPEAPISTSTSPGRTSRLISLSTCVAPKDLLTPLRLMMGLEAAVVVVAVMTTGSFYDHGGAPTATVESTQRNKARQRVHRLRPVCRPGPR